MSHPAIKNIIKHYKTLCDSNLENYHWILWTDKRKRFSEKEANIFFVSVLLDQGQKTERAWEGGRHLVENYFDHPKGFWYGITEYSLEEITHICQNGFNGTSYALKNTFNKFPQWLNSNANKMLEKYDGDPRKIWTVKPERAFIIYDRFTEFDGIGDALAKMGQFILLRNYGIAGGSANQHLVSIKPDELVRRVIYRTGISTTSKISDVINSIQKLGLKSPADFDAASWIIGREYCLRSSPKCEECPLSETCDRKGLH